MTLFSGLKYGAIRLYVCLKNFDLFEGRFSGRFGIVSSRSSPFHPIRHPDKSPQIPGHVLEVLRFILYASMVCSPGL